MHTMGCAISSLSRIVAPIFWNMEPGTRGVIGPCVIRRETIRCHDEKLPPVVSAWLSSR